MSPCAYLAGLLHPLVIEELDLPARGFQWTPAVNGLFVPFLDGSSVQLWDDDERCEAEIRSFSPQDVRRLARHDRRHPPPPQRPAACWRTRPVDRRPADGGRDRRSASAPTPKPATSSTTGPWPSSSSTTSPTSACRSPYLGQGVIGTNASPFDPGTASIRFHHASGRLGGMPGMWGYVKGGMGMVSFYLCDAAREAGAVVATGVPVARIIPGVGVQLAAGEKITAPSRDLKRRSAPRPRHARQCRRSGLEGAGRIRPDRRLHRQAQRPAARTTQLHLAAGHPRASPLRPDQRPAH